MEDNQTPMFENLEMDHPENAKKEKPRVNCLNEILAELMSERKITDSQVVKATGIPWSTWSSWCYGEVRSQLADKNLLLVARFFNVSLEYLVYGIGSDEPAFEEFKKDE